MCAPGVLGFGVSGLSRIQSTAVLTAAFLSAVVCIPATISGQWGGGFEGFRTNCFFGSGLTALGIYVFRSLGFGIEGF